MPPKPKFTKEEIVDAALKLVSKRGSDALTARELGAALGSSARPIFTVFDSMEELQNEVRVAALKRFESYVDRSNTDIPLFKQVGMQMVMFGAREPKLYQLLFMRDNKDVESFDDLFNKLGTAATESIEILCGDYGLSLPQAKLLFENIWIYTFGLGTLCATRVCEFTEEELGNMLSTEFNALLLLVKSGNN